MRLHGMLKVMDIVVRLQDERGNFLTIEDPTQRTCDGARGFERLLPWNDDSFRCLGVVDPYGDTIFNRLQMPYLLDDIARLDLSSATNAERQGLEILELLARRCRDGVHLYIRFIGD
jgi:hypothetical protein